MTTQIAPPTGGPLTGDPPTGGPPIGGHADGGAFVALGLPLRPGDPADRPQVTCPEDAMALVRPVLTGRDREHCVLVALDTKHRLLGVRTVSVGTADHTFMAPREIFRDALDLGASAVFVAHNHPSGDPTPSADDRQVTRRLASAGATLGVELLDHLIIGDPDWRSLARDGLL